MRIVNIKTEYLKNPLGIDAIHPVLTWNLEGEDIRFQKAFEILYRINEGERKTVQKESSSTHYEFEEELKSRDRVSYRIRVQNEVGQWSEESEEQSFSIGLLKKTDWSAKWVYGDYPVSKKKRYPVDCFRKEFAIESLPKATLYITSLGIYEAYLNGKKVGNAVLAPGSTDPRKRVQYDTYDVSDLLKQGKNEIVILLADGWYRGSIGAKGFTYVFGKNTMVMAELELQNEETIITDESWSWSNDGPFEFADLKDGEVVDFNKTPSFQGKVRLGSYKGEITSSNNSHVIVISQKEATRCFVSKTGKKVYEFANNVAGNIHLKAKGKKGSRLHLVLGEMLDEQDDVSLKNVQCIRKGKKTPLQEIVLTLKEGENEYESKFFYGGFRYAEILEGEGIEILEIHQLAISTEMDEVSSFECSHPLINTFYENTIRSCRSNFVDIPTDCPTRERMGWTGDSQIIFDTASYLFDSHAFFRKHVKDIYDRQDKNGRLPQIAPYSAEDWFMDVMNGSVGWADAGVLIPYRMYLRYGDIRILKDHYDDMVRYAKFMIRRCGRAKGLYAIYAKPLHLSKENKKYGVNTGQSYGEWAEPNDVKAFVWTDFAMPHPEESMAYTSYILSLMVEISHLLGREEDIALFQEYAEGVKRAYQELVSKPNFSLDTDRQCKQVRPLYFGLLNDEQKAFAEKRLLEALDHYRWRLGTGFLSTPFILYVLEKIDPEYAYKLLLNEEMPGWLYMAKENTGTIWEGWEGPNAQQGISSLNHYSKGAVVEWLFSSMLGIKIEGENEF
ncbi:MAG: family 78 glycoside hydrolase catalytic domain, partial [Bacilli bacterium]|nr:family 78 glycoside hydrolase catalytic domain [Bacilli bacterium]